MKLTGKYLGDLESSFVEFDVDCLPSKDEQETIEGERSCYESIWMGKSSFKDGGFSLMMGFDDCEQSDIDLICEYLDEESQERMQEMYDESQRVIF